MYASPNNTIITPNYLILGTLNWRSVFKERFKLRRSWLKGQCHVRTFEGHSAAISCVQFDSGRIVSGSHDKTIRVWNIKTNSPWSVMTLTGHSGEVRCLHLEGNRLVSGSVDTTIKVWDLDIQPSYSSIGCRVTMVGHSNTVRCVQMSHEKGKILVFFKFSLKVSKKVHKKFTKTLFIQICKKLLGH